MSAISPAPRRDLLIDTHAHVISADIESFPRAPLGGVPSRWSQERTASAAELTSQMLSARVDLAIAVQASTVYGHDNSYVAASVKGSEGRLAGVGSIDFRASNATEQIIRWTEDEGLSGLRLFVTGTTVADDGMLDAPETMRAWAEVAQRGIPVALQINADLLPRVQALADSFSGLRLLLDHAGRVDFSDGPPYAAAEPVYRLSDVAGIYLKVTSRTLQTAARSSGGSAGALLELISRFGADRIVWGSNFPGSGSSLRELVTLLDAATQSLAAEPREQIRSGTALRLYPARAAAKNDPSLVGERTVK